MFFIATPNFNYGRFLGDAIESVRMQGLESNHHVQDGGSTDDSSVIAEKHSWPGLSYASAADRGQCDAVNNALSHAKGNYQYVAWLNSDEYYLPFAFEQVAKFFEENPNIDIVFGDCIHIDQESRYIRLVAQHGFSRHVLRSYGTFLQTGSTFFRRAVLDRGDLSLNLDFKQVMDLELFVRLDRLGYNFGHIKTPLSAFRVHPEQLTAIHGSEFATRERANIAEVRNGTIFRTGGRLLHGLLKLVSGASIREWLSDGKLGYKRANFGMGSER